MTYEITYRYELHDGRWGLNTSRAETDERTDDGIARACAETIAGDAARFGMAGIEVIGVTESGATMGAR